MTNEEIMQKWYNNELSFDELLNLARADERAKLSGLYHSQAAVDAMIAEEREKLQGVDVWISWSGDEVDNCIPCVSRTKPEILNNGDYCQTSQGFNISRYEAQSLNISPGECAKFKIVRCE